MKPHIEAWQGSFSSLVGFIYVPGMYQCRNGSSDIIGTGKTMPEAYAAWKLAKERRGEREAWEKRAKEVRARDECIYTLMRLGLFVILATLIGWML